MNLNESESFRTPEPEVNAPANQQDEEVKGLDDESYIETDRGDYLSEKKAIPVIPTMNNKEQRVWKVISLSDRYQQRDPVYVARKIIEDIGFLGVQLNVVWNKLVESIQIEPKYILELLRFDYETKIREKWGESIFRNIIDTNEFAYPSEENVPQIHKEIMAARDNSGYADNLDSLPVLDLRIWK